jgi:serine/threonine-protein kinase
MSPEQFSNVGGVTASTDLYALGVVAYEIFAGRVPFEHAELVPLMAMHLHSQPEAPRKWNPRLPASLEAVILKLLEKEPANRYASCREVAAALLSVRRSLGLPG